MPGSSSLPDELGRISVSGISVASAASLTPAANPAKALSIGSAPLQATASPPSSQHIVVPAYFPPGPNWTRIEQMEMGTIVVYDIGIGSAPPIPTPTPDNAAKAQVQRSQSKGLKVFGYIPTNGGKGGTNRSLQEIKLYVDHWYSTYQPDGIFFDEGPEEVGKVPFYADLYNYVKGKTGVRGNTVLLNGAGVTFEEIMGLADIINLWEGSCAEYNTGRYYYMSVPWLPKYPPGKISHVITNCPSAAEMRKAIQCSKDRGAGYVYVLDTNHRVTGYDHLPSEPYWSQEVASVASGQTSTERPPIDTITDRFDTAAISASLWHTPTEQNRATVGAGGALTLSPQPNTGNSRAALRSASTHRLRSSAISVRVPQVVSSGGNVNTAFTLMYETPAADPSRLEWFFERNNLIARYTVNTAGGTSTTPVAVLPYSSTDHAWWRIREAGGTVYWETSPNGTTWVQRGSVPVGQLFSLEALKIEFTATEFGSTGTATPGQARYDDLNVSSPLCTSTSVGYFPATGHCVGTRFLAYWNAHGGLPINGYPISEEFTEKLSDGRYYAVQYFERVRMEYHPENSPPHDVLLGQFGLRIRRADPPVAPKPGATVFPATGPTIFFPATGHNLDGDFGTYWQSHGGLSQFGYPITEEFTEMLEDGMNHTVQYFERARFEKHPNSPPHNVLLGLFGVRVLVDACR
ncbi:MAG TPA: spherulation-specific family 4 protein [Chloroflexia bacterium]